MPVKCDEYNQICVMAVNGDLAGENATAMRAAVDEHIERRHIVDFVVDFEKVTFVDSEGLETLLWLKKKVDDMFGQVKLVNLDESCRKILEITRLEHRFECHVELAGALKTMR